MKKARQDIRDLLDQLPPKQRRAGLKRWALLKSLPSYGHGLSLREGPLRHTWTLRGEFKVPPDVQGDESLVKAYVEKVREEMKGLAIILGQALLKVDGREDVLVDSYYNVPSTPRAFVVRLRIERKSEASERRKVLKYLFDALYWRTPSIFRGEPEHYLDPETRMLDPAKLEEIPEWTALKEALVEKGYIRDDYLPLVSFTVLEEGIKEAIGPLPRGAPAKCIVCGGEFLQSRKDRKVCSDRCRMRLSRIKRMVEEKIRELGIKPGEIITYRKMRELIALLEEEEERKAQYARRFGKEPPPIPDWEGLIRHILEGGK